MNKSFFIIAAVIIGLIIFNASVFVVSQTEQAIVLEFGKPVNFTDKEKEVPYIDTPGLKFKLPFIQDVVFSDKRILNFNASDKEVLDVEKKTITVNAFAKYKITNPLRFYEKVTSSRGIDTLLDKIFEASLRDAIGGVTISNLLTNERTKIIATIQKDVSERSKDFGVEVFDVRIVRADLPSENSVAIYKRMYSERNKEAREYRAQGQEQARIIRSKADKEVTVLIAEAEREAEIIRGQGDGNAIKIFSSAFNKDPDFFQFYRTLQAYKQTLNKEDTRLLLSPNSEFLKYLKDIDTPR